MMKKILFAVLFMSLSVLLFAQSKQEKKEIVNTHIPIQSQYSNIFEIRNVYFNRKIDLEGKGEILEIEMEIRNLTDVPMDLYLFTIASYEKVEKTLSSFEVPVPEKERIRNFVPYPDDIKNFEYDDTKKGGIKFVKFPKNPKAGVDASTGKAYHLKNRIIVRTLHLSRYKTNYTYFNEVTILLFDAEGKPVFRQLYTISGTRKR